jgi:hypothetical protein
MRRQPRARPVIKIACLTRGAPAGQRRAPDRFPAGHPGTFASRFCPERAPAAASAR